MPVEAYLDEFTRRDWQTAADGEVRMAVVGLGTFAVNRALPAMRQSPWCEPTVLVSSSPEKAGAVGEEFSVDDVIDYDEFHSGTAADRFDAVYIATPPAFHLDYVESAASMGKHILCEKPLAATVNDAERIVEACDRHDVELMTAYRLRTEPAVRRVREMIQEGVIGTVVHIRAGFSTRLTEYQGTDTWRLDPDIAGGGALIDVGIHPLNLARFLLDADPIAAWGDTDSRTEPFAEVEEHASFQIRFDSGATTSGFASFNAHPDNRLHVLGTDGQIFIREPFGGKVSQELLIESQDTRTEYIGEPVDEVVEEFDYFAHCLLADTECEADGRDGLTDLRIVDGIYRAADRGERVALDGVPVDPADD